MSFVLRIFFFLRADIHPKMKQTLSLMSLNTFYNQKNHCAFWLILFLDLTLIIYHLQI